MVDEQSTAHVKYCSPRFQTTSGCLSVALYGTLRAALEEAVRHTLLEENWFNLFDSGTQCRAGAAYRVNSRRLRLCLSLMMTIWMAPHQVRFSLLEGVMSSVREAEALQEVFLSGRRVPHALCLSPGRAARQPRAARHRGGSAAGRRARRGSPVFQLRCDAPAEGGPGCSEPRDAQEVADLRHLQELFSRSFERGVVEAVYDAQGGSLAATSAALLAMSADRSSAGPASSPAAANSATTSEGKPRQAWCASVAAWQ